MIRPQVSKSRTKNTLRNTTSGLAMKLFNLFANFAVRTLFIKYLGIEYTGVSSVFTSILTVLSFAELGVGSAITFALYKPIEDKDFQQIARLVNLYRNAYRIIAAVVFVVGMSLIPFLDMLITEVPTIKEPLSVIYSLYIINTTLSYLLIYKSTLLTANQQASTISAISASITVIRTIFQAVSLCLFRNFLVYLILTILFTVIQNLLISLRADKQFPEINQFKNLRLPKEERKSVFQDIKALTLYKVSGTILNGTDNLVISSFLGAKAVGYASNYTLITHEVYSLILQFLNAVTASVGNMVASKDNKRQYDLFCMMNFFCQFFFCLCTVCLINLLDEFIGTVWLGSKYIVDSWSMMFLCIDFYLKGNATIVNSFRNANGLFVQGQYRPLIMAILNVVISIIAAKLIGLPGVFLGTVVSRVATQTWVDPMILYGHAFGKSTKGYFAEYLLWVAILVVATLVTGQINRLLVIPIPVISFLIHGIVSAAVVCGLTILVFAKSDTLHMSIKYGTNVLKKLILKK